MAHDDDDDRRSSGNTGTLIKGGLMALGGLFALFFVVYPLLGIGMWIASRVVMLGLLAGAGYLGYRMIAGGGERKAVGGGRSHRALGPGRSRGGSSSDDFERKMRELDAIEKRLDAEIGKR